jgi:hypothetical protein
MDPTCGSGRAKGGGVPSPFHTLQTQRLHRNHPRRPCVIQQQMSKPTRQSAGTQRTPVSPRKPFTQRDTHMVASSTDGRCVEHTSCQSSSGLRNCADGPPSLQRRSPWGLFFQRTCMMASLSAGLHPCPCWRMPQGPAVSAVRAISVRFITREVTRATAPIEGKSFELRIFATGGAVVR